MTLGGPASAFLIVDMQNDFVHPNGAYGRAGQTADAIAALVPRHRSVADAMRSSGGWTISTQFTLVPGRGRDPLISDHLRRLRPFLTKGDFAPGSWGHALIDELQPADFTIEKVAYSAFYMSSLDFVLAKAGVTTLVIGGIVTNGGVASTLRDAHVRGFRTVLLTDGCAAFSAEAHDATVKSLATVSETMTCADCVGLLQAPADASP